MYGQRVRFDRGYNRYGRDHGKTNKVSITLLESSWTAIDLLIKEKKYRSRSDYFRTLHEKSKEN